MPTLRAIPLVLRSDGRFHTTTAHAKAYYDYSTGFRCCADEGTLEDATSDEELPAPPAKTEETPAPRPALHGAPGTGNADDDETPMGINTDEVSEGDRRSFAPVGMMRRLGR